MSADLRELQLRLRDVTYPEGDDGQRQIIEVLYGNEVLGQLPGVTRVAYEMAINEISQVTLNIDVRRVVITT